MKRTREIRQKRHAQRRSLERFRIEITTQDYEKLCSMIRAKKKERTVFLFRESNRLTHWAIFYEDTWLPVVYDSQRGTIITILPGSSLDRYQDKLVKE